MKSDILVINSTHFVGSNICNYLLQHTRLIISGIDNLESGYIGNLQPSLSSKARFNFYPMTLADNALFSRALNLILPQYIIADLVDDCVPADVVNMLDAGSKLGVEKCIIIYPSYLSPNDKFKYDLLSSILKNKNYKYDNLEVVVLTPCELYGPRQNLTGRFAFFATSILSGTTPQLSESETLQWLYVKDLFHNILKIMEPSVLAPGAYSLKTRIECNADDVLSFMQSLISGQKSALKINPSSAVSDINAIDAINHFDLESSMEHTLCWYADNKWAWR